MLAAPAGGPSTWGSSTARSPRRPGITRITTGSSAGSSAGSATSRGWSFDVYDGEFNEEFPLTILEFYANLMPAGLGPKPLNRTPDGWWSNWDESILGWMDDLRESRDAAWLAIEEPLVTGLEKMRERIRTRQVVKS